MRNDPRSHDDLIVLAAVGRGGREFTSGSAIAAELGVSRQMVSKRVARLRKCGYQIDGVNGRGYRLKEWRTP